MVDSAQLKKSVYKEPKQAKPTYSEKKYSEALLKLVKEETKTVKGVFRSFTSEGNPNEGYTQKIVVRKFPEDLCPPFVKWMTEGETYEIPLYVARFLNGIDAAAKNLNGKVHSCQYPIHGFKTSAHGPLRPSALGQSGVTGQPGVPLEMSEPKHWKKRYGFEAQIYEMDPV